MEQTDEQLISDFLRGDETAFNKIVERYLKHIYNFVYRFTQNVQDAEDVTQESFLKVWKHLKKYDQRRGFKTWLFTIARNTAIDWLRKKKNIVFSHYEDEEGNNPLTESLTDPAPLPDALYALAEDKRLLDGVISELSPIYREVLLLRYNEHFTFKEIGNILGRPQDTVKSQHRRALQALRKLLEHAPNYVF